MPRHADKQDHYFNSSRVFHSASGWYFMTREVENVGPFSRKEEVFDALDLYKLNVLGLKIDTESLDDFDWSDLDQASG